MANKETQLIQLFYNEETFNVEVNDSGNSLTGVFKWCRQHAGTQGIDWELIQMGDNILFGIFLDKEVSVLFGLTWG